MMIVKPHPLPLAVLNLFAPMLSWIHRAPPAVIEERLLRVAQEGHTDYAPYCLRWHYQPLPQALKEKLKAALCGTVKPMPTSIQLQNLYPRLTEGASQETFVRKPRLLFAPAQPQTENSAHT